MHVAVIDYCTRSFIYNNNRSFSFHPSVKITLGSIRMVTVTGRYSHGRFFAGQSVIFCYCFFFKFRPVLIALVLCLHSFWEKRTQLCLIFVPGFNFLQWRRFTFCQWKLTHVSRWTLLALPDQDQRCLQQNIHCKWSPHTLYAWVLSIWTAMTDKTIVFHSNRRLVIHVQATIFAGQNEKFTGQWPMTGTYFEPCFENTLFECASHSYYEYFTKVWFFSH